MNVRKAISLGLVAALLMSIVATSGCGARSAPDIRGRWKPVNRYQAQTQEIPLRPAYAFYATPMDRTLKSMLERWARDTRMSLAYEHGSDFTLHAPVAQLGSHDLPGAIEALNGIYASQQVVISLDGSRIVVRRGGGS